MDTKVLVKKYKILEPLASGGMATVYLAKNMATDEIVVAKIPNFIGLPSREKLEQRFIREAQILSKIKSEYVVRIHDYGIDEDLNEYFLILEYLHGKTLEEITMSKERIPIPTVIDLTSQMAQVLNDLFNQGIIHRDIKSSNIKITSEGNIKLFDFGISKGKDLPSMTRSTDFLGTLQYMSPEQADGREVDIRSDIYSLGIVLYEMLFGELPFDAPSPVEVLEMQRKQNPKIPPSANERGIPASLLSLMLRCMKKDPGDRYQNPEELINALKIVAGETGMSEKERETLRRTKFTRISARAIPTYVARKNKKRTALISAILAGLMVIGGGFFAWKGCGEPIEPDFQVAQGETIEYELPLSAPPNAESMNATISEVPKGLMISLEETEINDQKIWILTTFAKFKTSPGIYPIKLDIQYILPGNLSDSDEQPFFIEVIPGNLGSKAMKIVKLEDIENQPGTNVEEAVSIDGKTYVPIGKIGEVTSASTQFDKETETMIYSQADTTTIFFNGEKYVEVDGKKKDISEAPLVVKDTMIVSEQTAEETMNIEIETDIDKGEVEITYNEPEPALSTVKFIALDEEEKEIQNATVLFGNSVKGYTPLSMQLPLGNYDVLIVLDGYETSKDSFTLKSQQRITKEYILKKIVVEPDPKPEPDVAKTGTLKISVNVPWGDFIFDGKTYANRTSLTLKDISTGYHTVTYKLKGFNNITKKLKVEGNKTTIHDFKVNSGILVINCNIAASVYVDDKPLGAKSYTPYEREVAAKTYQISVDRTNFVDTKTGEVRKNQTVTVVRGQTKTVTFNLKKKE